MIKLDTTAYAKMSIANNILTYLSTLKNFFLVSKEQLFRLCFEKLKRKQFFRIKIHNFT